AFSLISARLCGTRKMQHDLRPADWLNCFGGSFIRPSSSIKRSGPMVMEKLRGRDSGEAPPPPPPLPSYCIIMPPVIPPLRDCSCFM
ncbi:hypothetical protein CRG98_025888, partial [Punica granatum]